MFAPVVTVFSLLQQDAELDGLIGLIVVHRTQVQLDHAKEESSEDREQEEPVKGNFFIHFTGVP